MVRKQINQYKEESPKINSNSTVLYVIKMEVYFSRRKMKYSINDV